MNVTISVTAPAAGTYTVTVEQPTGTRFNLNETFSSAGQTQNATFGNATSGFNGAVSQVGTYNVFVEQGSTVVSSTSFYATNKLLINIEMVTGGTCDFVSGVSRGMKMFPHTYITYASNGAKWTNASKGWSVNGTLPSGQIVPLDWDPYSIAFELGVLPNWNYTYVGNWVPSINASDAAGNVGFYKDTGAPYTISPAILSTSVAVVNSQTNQTLSGITNGTSATIYAIIKYPTNAEPVPGFVAPLDSVNRGGSVTALFGWGYYNATSHSFGGGKTVGGVIGQVSLTYTGTGGVWKGNYTASSVPPLAPGTSYEVVVNAKDDASPANTGFASVTLGPSSAVSPSTSTVSTSSTTPSSSITTTTSIPLWAYAGTTIALIVGVIVGFLARRPKS